MHRNSRSISIQFLHPLAGRHNGFQIRQADVKQTLRSQSDCEGVSDRPTRISCQLSSSSSAACVK